MVAAVGEAADVDRREADRDVLEDVDQLVCLRINGSRGTPCTSCRRWNTPFDPSDRSNIRWNIFFSTGGSDGHRVVHVEAREENHLVDPHERHVDEHCEHDEEPGNARPAVLEQVADREGYGDVEQVEEEVGP